jgi:large subunit ribosomal protein L4
VELELRNMNGDVVGQIEVRDDVFGAKPNVNVIHQVMVAQLANRRQGTHQAKTRAQVSGGGIKPRPQKYTGRARQGSIRSPQWRGGGIVFGPSPRS